MDELEEVDVVPFETLFDGEEHWLSPGVDWIAPFVKHVEFVPLEVGHDMVVKDGVQIIDPISGPDLGAVVQEDSFGERLYMTEDGWSALSLMLQAMGEALGGRMICEQFVYRDKKWNVTEKRHRVQFVGKGSMSQEEADAVVGDVDEDDVLAPPPFVEGL